MKILSLLFTFVLLQGVCSAYTSPYFRQNIFSRGVMTGITPPIIQYNVPRYIPQYTPQYAQPYYINRKHIKKKYRRYYPVYPTIDNQSTYTYIEN